MRSHPTYLFPWATLSAIAKTVLVCVFVATTDTSTAASPWNEYLLSQDNSSANKASSAAASRADLIEQIGIQGAWKLGQTCNVQLTIPADIAPQVVSARVITLDGDGVEVCYRADVPSAATSVHIPIRIGRRLSVLSVSLLDSDGKQLASQDRQFTTAEGLEETQPLILCLGSAMGLEDLVRSNADKSKRSIDIVEISQADALPTSWLTYQPCNLVVISTRDIELIRSISPSQWEALLGWIRRGGACVISLGCKAQDLQAVSQLAQLLPGTIRRDGIIENPAALESLITLDQPLQKNFPFVDLDVDPKLVQLSLRSDLAQPAAWWIRHAVGFGTIQTITSDLSHPAFANWKQRSLLWERLVSPYIDKSLLEARQSEYSSSTGYLGYSDIIGQLRATLDLFSQVNSLSFSQIAAILIAILILVGPIDYLICVRWLKRPELSWPLAGIMLLACSCTLAWYHSRLRPDLVIVNRVQIMDVDPSSGRADGHLWSHVYSAKARQVDLNMTDGQIEVKGFLDWQGLPGSGLGGLQSQLTMERGMPIYQVERSLEGSSLAGLGIPAAGSKSVYGTYSAVLHLTGAESDLRELDSVDQLVGRVVNPLDIELRDVSLFYHRWFYPLKSRMPAGDDVQISSQIIPKDILRRLNRQQEVDGKTASSRWNPADRQSIDRLMELMMFHQAATGRNYSSLTHDYQPIVDHSYLLELDYAILVGRIDTPPVNIQVSPSDSQDQPEIRTDLDRTWCRILIPVQKSDRYKLKSTR